MEIIYRQLNKEDLEQFLELYKIMNDNLTRKEFFIPYTDEEINDIFGSLAIYYTIGAFVEYKLVGAGYIHFNETDTCQFGGYMVDPNYGGRGIMTTIQDKLFEVLENHKHIKTALVNVHPENIPSIKVLQKRFKLIKSITRPDGIERNIYKAKLNHSLSNK